MGCHAFLQRIFQTQGSNPCLLHLLHWQAGSLLSHLGFPGGSDGKESACNAGGLGGTGPKHPSVLSCPSPALEPWHRRTSKGRAAPAQPWSPGAGEPSTGGLPWPGPTEGKSVS